MSAISTLVSMMKTEQALAKISSTNIASANEEGYARKNADVISLNKQGNLGGTTLSKIYNTIDPLLQSQTRKENSIYSQHQVTDHFYQKLKLIFGNKGDQNSFIHQLGRFTSTLQSLADHPDPLKKMQVIREGVAYCHQINRTSKTLQGLREEVDQALGKAVDEVNHLVGQIKGLNQKISSLSYSSSSPVQEGYIDVTTFENQRDLLVHQLSSIVDITVFKTEDNKINMSLAGSGRTLLQGLYDYQLEYSNPPLGAGDDLSPLLYLGDDITQEIKNGQIAGLFQMRDQILTDAQQEMDELTRVFRDTLNAVHNQGISLSGPSVLTGASSLPGLNGPIRGDTPISGVGTVRLGVMDAQGMMKDYKNIALTDGMTIGGLIQTIGQENFKVSGGAAAAIGGEFTITQTENGSIQLQSTDRQTMIIGGVGGNPPMLSLGANYDPGQGLGFSHFFGFNNLFMTGDDLASPIPQQGLAQKVELRSDFMKNPEYLCLGTLSIEETIPQGEALGQRKTDIAQLMHQQMTKTPLPFQQAGKIPANFKNIQDYATQIFTFLEGEIQQSSRDLKLHESIYTQLASLNAEKTSVDVSEELIKMYMISSSQHLAAKALSLTLEMKEYFLNII